MILYQLRTKTCQGLFRLQLVLSMYMQEVMVHQYNHVTNYAYLKKLIKRICRSDIDSSLATKMLHYIKETIKEHHLVSMNKFVSQSCAMSSVDVPYVSDVIVRFNVSLISYILPIQQRLLSKYRCLRICLKRNVMECRLCKISVLNLVFEQLNYFQAKNPVFIVKTCLNTILKIFCYLLLFCLFFQGLFVLYYQRS